MDSVKTLLDAYGLADPVGADTPGVFTNAELQAAYDALVAQGTPVARGSAQSRA